MISYLIGVLLFALGIAVTIGVHEAGHYTAARATGMRVRRFFIGFGPKVFSFTRGHTEYGFKLIPLGGFCDIAGMTNQDEVTKEEEPYAMRDKPAWKRIIVLLGGVFVNFIIAFVIFYLVALTSGLADPKADYTPTVGEVTCVAPRQLDAQTLAECSGTGPAGEAGLLPGDKITAVDGEKLESFVALRDYVMARPGETITLSVVRGSENLEIAVPVATASRLDSSGNEVTVGAIGVSNAPVVIEPSSATESFVVANHYMGFLMGETVKGVAAFPGKIPGVAASIFGGEREVDSPVSVVGASRVGGELAERSMWSSFFLLLANLNLFLAVFNLIPLPPLDGGHIAVVLYEKVRDFIRRLRGLPAAGPADYQKLMPLTMAVAALLVGVGVIVILADVVNPIRAFG